MSSPSAWTLSLCTSISLVLSVSALLTPDSRQEVKTATKAPSNAADGPAKVAQRIDLSRAMNVNLPALAKGNVYAGTSDGRLICLKTGNKDADGWYAWGGNAQHNKIQ